MKLHINFADKMIEKSKKRANRKVYHALEYGEGNYPDNLQAW